MNNKRNVIVMFLFVMLSFAIISEVSAGSDAEADGTGFDVSGSVDVTTHDIASERNNQFMQNHENDHGDNLKSHNEQNSFNNSPEFKGDNNIENRNFYEQNLPFNDGNKSLGFNESVDLFKQDDKINFDDLKSHDKPMDNFNMSNDKFNSSMDLRNNNFTAVPMGEARNDIIPKFNDSNNMPNFKNDDKNLSGPIKDSKIIPDNVSNQHVVDDRNKSHMLPADIVKKSDNIKLDKKPKNAKHKLVKKVKKNKSKVIKKSKVVKKPKNNKSKTANKPKFVKKPKNLNKNSQKKSKKERAKL